MSDSEYPLSMTSSGSVTTVEGMVEGANDNGIKVKGEWLNRSQFAPVELPSKGSYVRAQVDARGYLKSVELVGEPAATTSRLTVLEAAAHFAAARTDIKSSDVLRIAESWLEWVGRD